MFLSLFFCLMSYLNNDPVKCSFFLVLSMLLLMPAMSFFSYVWYSYFVSMIFLSGVFVILVYFSSLSSFFFFKAYWSVLFFFLSLFFFSVGLLSFCSFNFLGLSVFYCKVNFFLLLYLVFILLGYMNFVSYYLSFSGALRKV
uniref:NADH dehydrogenase subunit 6 n=1 Tax=Aelurostrongylus abstrusus TaxID=321389 RepID=K7QG87_AELAB|nr:NADH dehydrogenase subunit 6 [Aelurostrongylus abstrusus]AFT65552.1 NADH dehydrogenase subunit 6 [Aelurostrongylus abstrusus]